MGNIALSAEDIAFLKEKGNNKTSDSDIKNAFKEFKVDLDVDGKKMHEVKINFDQFCVKADTVFNTRSDTLQPDDKKMNVYQHLFRAFDQDQVVLLKSTQWVLQIMQVYFSVKFFNQSVS